MLGDAPLILFDDARGDGWGEARLYREPVRVIEARTIGEVRPTLDAVRAALAEGLHAAGFVSYEAGFAFEPTTGRVNEAAMPLVWFGLFDGYEAIEDVTARLPDPAGAWVNAAEPGIDRDTYDAMIAEVLSLIEAGDLYQANLTFRARVRTAGDRWAVYAKLRGNAAAGWGALVETGRDALLSFSPELFFALADGALTCRPMKGTARRGADARADAAAAKRLTNDEKQRAENLMIVDLMRNDLSRVAAAGSVAVPELFAIESYPTVHQMTSTVTATLAAGRDAVDVIAALFPCGSITGAPKIRAMQAIGAIEREPRGPYAGAIGWIEPGGDARFNVAIRTLWMREGEASATIGVGGGIVADSRADSEWDEALAKGAFLTLGARRFDLIETMGFDPGDGIALLARHLDRMAASAATFGYPFDAHAVRNRLQAATFRLRAPHRVRLLLAPSGAIAIEVAPAPKQRDTPLRVAIAALPVDGRDFRLRHKTSDRRFYDSARRAAGADEVVFVTPRGFLTEGSFTSLFVERDKLLVTPPLTRGLLPGVLRAALLDEARAIEGDLTPADLAGGFLLGNALRGLTRAIVAAPDAAPL